MHVYRISVEYEERGEAEIAPAYAGTLVEARSVCRVRLGYVQRGDCVYVDLLVIPTDKATLVRMLNGADPTVNIEPTCTWELTRRGGLRRITKGA